MSNIVWQYSLLTCAWAFKGKCKGISIPSLSFSFASTETMLFMHVIHAVLFSNFWLQQPLTGSTIITYNHTYIGKGEGNRRKNSPWYWSQRARLLSHRKIYYQRLTAAGIAEVSRLHVKSCEYYRKAFALYES